MKNNNMTVMEPAGSNRLLIICFLLLLFCLIVFMLSCSKPNPIKIAFIGAISGKNSEVGVSVRNAIQMKVDFINQDNGVKGRQIELGFFDNQGDPLRCQEQFSKLLKEGYKFVLGPIFSQMAEITLNAIKDKDILVISPTMSSDYLSNRDDNFIRTTFPASDQAKLLAEYIVHKNIKTVAVIYDLSNKKYTEGLYQFFRKISEPHGITFPLVQPIEITEQMQMLPIAQSIQKVQPEAVLMCLSAIDAANLAQQLKKTESNPLLLGVSWAQTNDLLEHGGRAVEGMVLIAVYKSDKKTPLFLNFESDYKNRYDKEPSFPGIMGYDSAGIMIRGMQNATAITPVEVKKAIIVQKEFEGLNYPIHINKFGDALGNFELVTVKDNAFRSMD